MYQKPIYRRRNLFDNNGLQPARSWKSAVGHMLLLICVVFFTEIATVRADGLFDFQMKLAEKGNAEAQFKIGEMYETGFGTTKNMKLAEEWINKAAAQGHETARFKQLYWDMKKNGLTKDNKARYEELASKAKDENGYAEYYMGKLSAEGAGVPQDKEKALDFYNQATLKGIVEAEREAVNMRDQVKKDEIARQQEEQRRQAELKAKRDEEARKAQAERLAAEKKAESERAAKQSEEKRKQSAAKQAEDTKALEAKKAADKKAEKAALEARRQALLDQREQNEEERKAKFESDPCSGKSARFLSTCR